MLPVISRIKITFYLWLLSSLLIACTPRQDSFPGPAAITPAVISETGDIFFSEYIEGSSSNKALEIFNATGQIIQFDGTWTVSFFANGSDRPALMIPLQGEIAPGDVFVLAHERADPGVLSSADQIETGGWFNGNDAVLLEQDGQVIDVIGQVGADPGTGWGTGSTSTADHTLRRKTSVRQGDRDASDPFDPTSQWDGHPVDTFDDLGKHSVPGIGAPVLVSCGQPVSLDAGVSGSTSILASDADGIVNQLAVEKVTPKPRAGGFLLAEIQLPAAAGEPARALLAVDPATPVETYQVQIRASNSDSPPQAGRCSLTIAILDAPVAISTVQGAGHLSPVEGDTVRIEGIVTAVSSNGFWLQDPQGDGDAATSDGIFIFTNKTPEVSVGDDVRAGGKVSEYIPGGESTGNLSTTELVEPLVEVFSSGNPLPEPVVIGIDGRLPPRRTIENDANGNVEINGIFDPQEDGIDFYEALEGMRVQVNQAVAASPTNAYGEIAVLGDLGSEAGLRTPRGGIVIQPGDFNPERIILDDTLLKTPVVTPGDRFTTPIVGVLDYSFGNFKLFLTELVEVTRSNLAPEIAALPSGEAPGEDLLSIGTFNVENLSPGDGLDKFAIIATQIVKNLGSPDILGLQEIQDNSGAMNDDIVDASETYAALIAAIQAAGGPIYDWRDIPPVDDLEGGEPGGNIRVGFLYRPDRVEMIDRPSGAPDATISVDLAPGGGSQLSASPGRIQPRDPAFSSSRPPLAGEFRFRDQRLIVVNNHWASKGGDDPLFGRMQPPGLYSEGQRIQQARIVHDFVEQALALDPDVNVVVLGDLNDFQFSAPLSALKEGDILVDLVLTLPTQERYTYLYDGNSQVLDHILTSPGLFEFLVGYDIVHTNAEFPPGDRPTDHDPSVAWFRFP